jgi:hypothetical protein
MPAALPGRRCAMPQRIPDAFAPVADTIVAATILRTVVSAPLAATRLMCELLRRTADGRAGVCSCKHGLRLSARGTRVATIERVAM